MYPAVADRTPTRHAIVTPATVVKSTPKSARVLYSSCVVTAKRPMYAAMVIGWNRIAREASCRCCAIESAMSFNAGTFSVSSVNTPVVRGGTESRGFGVIESSSSARDVISASEDGNSGKVCEDNGSRSGVEVVEFRLEGGRTRFARRNIKKANNKC